MRNCFKLCYRPLSDQVQTIRRSVFALQSRLERSEQRALDALRARETQNKEENHQEWLAQQNKVTEALESLRDANSDKLAAEAKLQNEERGHLRTKQELWKEQSEQQTLETKVQLLEDKLLKVGGWDGHFSSAVSSAGSSERVGAANGGNINMGAGSDEFVQRRMEEKMKKLQIKYQERIASLEELLEEAMRKNSASASAREREMKAAAGGGQEGLLAKKSRGAVGAGAARGTPPSEGKTSADMELIQQVRANEIQVKAKVAEINFLRGELESEKKRSAALEKRLRSALTQERDGLVKKTGVTRIISKAKAGATSSKATRSVSAASPKKTSARGSTTGLVRRSVSSGTSKTGSRTRSPSPDQVPKKLVKRMSKKTEDSEVRKSLGEEINVPSSSDHAPVVLSPLPLSSLVPREDLLFLSSQQDFQQELPGAGKGQEPFLSRQAALTLLGDLQTAIEPRGTILALSDIDLAALESDRLYRRELEAQIQSGGLEQPTAPQIHKRCSTVDFMYYLGHSRLREGGGIIVVAGRKGRGKGREGWRGRRVVAKSGWIHKVRGGAPFWYLPSSWSSSFRRLRTPRINSSC